MAASQLDNKNAVLFIGHFYGKTHFGQNVDADLFALLSNMPSFVSFHDYWGNEMQCVFLHWITGTPLQQVPGHDSVWVFSKHNIRNIDMLQNVIPLMFEHSNSRVLNLECNQSKLLVKVFRE